MIKYIKYIVLVVVVSIVSIMVYNIFRDDKKSEHIYEYIKVPEVKEIVKVEKVEVPVEKIKVVPKEKIKKEYIEVAKDNNVEVMSIGKVDCKDSEVKIVSLFNKTSHENELRYKITEKKLSFFYDKEIYFMYGVYNNGRFNNYTAGGIRFNIVRYKNINFSVGGRIDNIDGNIGAGLYGIVSAKF